MEDGYGIAVYETALRYGGPEDDGWYYETGSLIHSESGMATEAIAIRRATELREGEYEDTCVYSVLITDPGEDVPKFYPEFCPEFCSPYE